MEKLINEAIESLINEAIESVSLEYQSDVSWIYTNTQHKDRIGIDFGTNEDGKNDIYEFCVKQKGMWITILPTDKQLKRMFEILNNTTYREVEKEIESPWVSEDFDCYGHGYKGDYGL
jgi:hypothetical protein